MTHPRHELQGRHADEVLWFQRRQFLQAAALWTASGGYAAAQSLSRSNVVELQGDVLLNGSRLRPGASVATGDTVQTGPGSHLVVVIGNTALQLRQNTQLVIERGNTLNMVGLLRLLSGAVVGVFGPGQRRQITTPTLTAGIRGTGIYAEIQPHNQRTYFCTCWGETTLVSGDDRIVVKTPYHQAYWADGSSDGTALSAAQFINHTDEELEFLAMLARQKTAWQLSGVKGLAPRPGSNSATDAALD